MLQPLTFIIKYNALLKLVFMYPYLQVSTQHKNIYETLYHTAGYRNN